MRIVSNVFSRKSPEVFLRSGLAAERIRSARERAAADARAAEAAAKQREEREISERRREREEKRMEWVRVHSSRLKVIATSCPLSRTLSTASNKSVNFP